jgi:hypothetical protein
MLVLFLLVGSAVPSRADDHDKCEQKIRKAEQKLDKEVRKHGEHSRQAEQRRREVEQARANCRVEMNATTTTIHKKRITAPNSRGPMCFSVALPECLFLLN